MAKRKFQRDDPFSNSDPEPAANSWQEIDSQIFGESSVLEGLAAADAQRERIKRLDIFSILPDPQQPRRTMPSTIRNGWDSSAEGLHQAYFRWFEAVEMERGQAFDLNAYLEEDDETERSVDGSSYQPGPLEAALMQVVKLAASIRRDGLTNPVTVAVSNRAGRYVLETGERRWMAYHLLWLWYDGNDGRPDERQDWQRIPAREVKVASVWRQANENNARADLNAISKARQYAVLMMDLLDTEYDPLSSFKSEREFYAQIKDERVPSGKGEQLMSAMGISNRSGLTRYRRMLELPDEIWAGADDRDMPEELLYKLANIARTSPSKAIKRYRDIVAGRNNSAPAADYGPGTKRHFSELARAVKKAGHGKGPHNQEALKALHELRQWLELQEERIRKFTE